MKHLEVHREFVHLGPVGRQQADAAGLLPFEERSEAERRAARVILGHEVNFQTHTLVPGKVPRYVIFLRDPADLIVSRYNYQHRRPAAPPMPFDEWLKERGHTNFITQWLVDTFLRQGTGSPVTKANLASAQSALETFWFVGCTEFLDRDASVLLRRIGITAVPQRTNVAGRDFPKRLTLDEKLRQQLHERNELDVQLYRYWKERLPESLARITSP